MKVLVLIAFGLFFACSSDSEDSEEIPSWSESAPPNENMSEIEKTSTRYEDDVADGSKKNSERPEGVDDTLEPCSAK